jgi:hypothetical protein
MREPARRYLDMVGECLDLGPESRHEVMSELDNHSSRRSPTALVIPKTSLSSV